ncbi:MAG TPA: hypothetical protein VIH90_01765 [Candidatus Saccharimonadales bacterium]
MNSTTILYVIILLILLLLTVGIVLGFKLLRSYFIQLNKNIKNTVEPKFLDLSPSTSSLVELAIEVWRVEKRLAKAAESLTDDQNKAFENSTAKLRRFLDKNDITFTDYTDQKYNEGLNLDILSIEKDPSITESVIKETHEPAVLHKGQVVKKAKVVVLEK